jgi:hypothetical protein
MRFRHIRTIDHPRQNDHTPAPAPPLDAVLEQLLAQRHAGVLPDDIAVINRLLTPRTFDSPPRRPYTGGRLGLWRSWERA